MDPGNVGHSTIASTDQNPVTGQVYQSSVPIREKAVAILSFSRSSK